jgi:hypothetical protein
MTDARSLLARAGVLLYGERWQSDLARDLGQDPRRLRQWIAGERPIPSDIPKRLVDLLILRQKQIAVFVDEITTS